MGIAKLMIYYDVNSSIIKWKHVAATSKTIIVC